jgi:GTP 3',8-cyclase
MSERVIPLVDQRLTALRAEVPAHEWRGGLLLDQLQRPMHDLRISVTDRCNFRCNYCMPKEVFNKDYSYLPHSDLLNFEEITRLAKVFVGLGVRKIRLTGGEPLLRKNLEILVQQLAHIQTPDGSKLDLTLTTNGSLLTKKAQQLKDAGLDRITVSLDGLDDAVFRAMNDVDFPVRDVLDGIEAAQKAGLGIKVNMVVKRQTNTNQIVPMAKHFRGSGIALRFIEYMDVGVTNGWRMDEVLPSAEVVALVQQAFPLVLLPASVAGETAQRWGYAAASGKFDPASGRNRCDQQCDASVLRNM